MKTVSFEFKVGDDGVLLTLLSVLILSLLLFSVLFSIIIVIAVVIVIVNFVYFLDFLLLKVILSH